MLERVFRRASVRARIRANPAAQILQRYVEHLVARGHRGGIQQYVFAAEHFLRRLGGLPVDYAAVEQFTKRHLPRCHCHKPAIRNLKFVRAALNRLLEMLEIERPRPVETRVVAELLRRYEDHLRLVCGLAGSTVHYRLRYARDLLRRFQVRRVHQLATWSPAQIARYVETIGRKCKASSGQVVASSTRSFLRFLLLQGLVRRDLVLRPASSVTYFSGC